MDLRIKSDISPKQQNFIGFYELERGVYCAVRTEYLNAIQGDLIIWRFAVIHWYKFCS